VPSKKRRLTKKRIRVGASVAVNLLSILVLKRPALAPVLQLLNNLLAPGAGNDSDAHVRKVMGQVRKLKLKLETTTTDDERAQLNKKLEALYELLEQSEEDEE